MLLTAYIGGRCFWQFTAECQSFTPSAAQRTVSHPFCFFGQYTVQSQEGAQQGNPIGSLLFCNTIQPLLSSLHFNLIIGYLDDVTLGGHLDVVASDVAEIMRIGAEMGLFLNISKCELTTHSNLQQNDSLLQSFSRVDIADTTLLGAPLFHGPVLDSTWNWRHPFN